MSTPFTFREEKNQVFYHDLKIFIYGTDVTPWITSQVTLQRSDRDGTNSLSFNLSNQYRAFEITRENLGELDLNVLGSKNTNVPKFRLTDPNTPQGMYSELAKAKIYTLKTQLESDNFLNQIINELFGVNITIILGHKRSESFLNFIPSGLIPKFSITPSQGISLLFIIAEIKNNSIYEIHITDQGHGFNPKSSPKVNIEGGKGHGATAQAVIDDDGFLKIIKVINPGYNYTETPNVLIDAPFMNSSCHLCCSDEPLKNN